MFDKMILDSKNNITEFGKEKGFQSWTDISRKIIQIDLLSLEKKKEILNKNDVTYKIKDNSFIFYDKDKKIIKNNKYDSFMTITDFILKYNLYQECY